MNPFTYSIIDDEPPARAGLRTLMHDLEPESICIWEADDGISGLTLLERTPRPDLLFLDIQFPPGGAFGMLEQAKTAGIILPPIAFVTAYDRFALDAFRWAACNYLLKPVEPEQLRETLSRAKRVPDLSVLFDALHSLGAKRIPERFTVNVRGTLNILRWEEVTSIQTENRLVFVFTAKGRFNIDRNLDELEALLAPRFVRIHRSAIVNLAYIKSLLPDPGHTSRLTLLDGRHLPVSRDRLAHIKKELGIL